MRVAAVAVGLAAASLAAVPAVGAGRAGPVIKSFSPLSGVIGTRVQIKGSGFSRVRAVEFGGSRAAFRVRGAGKITASVPAAASSGRITVVTRSGTARSSRTFAVRAGLRLSAGGGPPDSPVTVQGAGFGSAERVTVDFGGSALAVTRTTRRGQFGPVAITVPATAVAGRHWISASGARSARHARSQYTVRFDNWTQFRFSPGLAGWNQGETVLSRANVGKLTQRWNLASAGYVYSSPAVIGNSVYEATGEDSLDAVNAVTGKLEWSFSTGPSTANDNSSPAVAGGTVYVGSFFGTLYAVNAATGKLKWSYSLPGAPALDDVHSPAVVGGVVYDTTDGGYVFALNASTGAKLWTNLLTNQGIGDAGPAVANGDIYVGGAHDIYALKASTGHQVWHFTTGDSVQTSPAVSAGVVYAGSDDDHVYALNATTGKKIWSSDPSGVTNAINDRINSSAGVADGLVYVGCGNGNLYALHASSGKVAWSFQVSPGDGIGFSSPAIANGVVYVGSVGGGIDALNSASGHLLWSGTINAVVDSSPAVANGAVVVGSEADGIFSFALTSSIASASGA